MKIFIFIILNILIFQSFATTITHENCKIYSYGTVFITNTGETKKYDWSKYPVINDLFKIKNYTSAGKIKYSDLKDGDLYTILISNMTGKKDKATNRWTYHSISSIKILVKDSTSENGNIALAKERSDQDIPLKDSIKKTVISSIEDALFFLPDCEILLK